MRLLPQLWLAWLVCGSAWAQLPQGASPSQRAEPAAAAPGAAVQIPVRGGDHPGLGRIVFDWPTPPAYTVESRGDVHVVRLPANAAPALQSLRRMPRNFVSLRMVAGGVEVTLAPGARLRHFRNGPKLAFDALDPVTSEGRPTAAAAPARPSTPIAPPEFGSARVQPVTPPSMVRAPAPPTTPAPGPATPGAEPAASPAPPPLAPSAPPALPARLILPFPPETGAAMLRRGDDWVIILDAAPEAPLSETPRPGMRYQPIPGGSMITIEAAGEAPSLRRAGARWELTGPAAAPEAAPILAMNEGGGTLVLPVAGAQRVLSIQDPLTGMPLLVGTLRQGPARIAAMRQLVDMQILETVLGVAVIARSDALVMRPAGERFVLGAQGGGRLSLGLPAGGSEQAAAVLRETVTRSFEMPAGTASELAIRLRAQQVGLAQMPPLARGALRLGAAETLLALGQPQEAQAMVLLARQEDPAMANLPKAAWLLGAAALAAGRLEEAASLDAAPISTETALWRGLYLAMRGQGGQAGPDILAGSAILRGYPEPLRRRLLPRAAEALGDAGQVQAAQALLEGGEATPGLELARALVAEQKGEAEAALAAYDAITAGRDRRMRAEAMRRATELRLTRNEIDTAAAARALEQTLFAWREEGEEFATRNRIAALRQAGGDPAGALALLRESAALFPDRQAALQPAISAAFMAALEHETPLNAVALHDAHPELMPSGAAGAAALSLLAERLTALDLSDRAVALLRQAMERAPPGEARAAAGARLAALHLAERDVPHALAALADSAATGLPLPPMLQRERSLLAARARAQQGEGEASAFAALGPAGDEALAEFLADRRDFAGAAAALGRHLDRALGGQPAPVAPALVRGLVRQAALLALAGDAAGLARLRAARAPLLAGGPGEGPFELLTTDPVRGLADLPRLQNELELFRVLPARLDRLRTASAMAR